MKLTLIKSDSIDDLDPLALYNLHIELLKLDDIQLAHKSALEALSFKTTLIEHRIELLWFFVRYDDGYKYIICHCKQIILFLNSDERILLLNFLKKLIELDYILKLDLPSELIALLIEN